MLRPILCLIACVLLVPNVAFGQPPSTQGYREPGRSLQRAVRPRGRAAPRKQFVTVTIDRSHTLPLHFVDKPLEQLAGRKLGPVREPDVDYRSSDGSTSVDVLEFRRRTRGAGVTVYPLGAGNGSALLVRFAYETLPIVRFTIDSPEGIERYSLADGRAYDFGIGAIVSDRSRGWGLGVHSFVVGGIGRLRGERGNGDRLFGEAGGGINFGPVGVELGVKVAYNKLKDPRPHNFLTVPVAVRGTLSF